MSDGSYGSEADRLAHLNALLDDWAEQNMRLCQLNPVPDEIRTQYNADCEQTTAVMANKARPLLPYFLRGKSDRTAEQLEELAGRLSPGGAHTGGRLAYLIYKKGPPVDALLLAAVMRWNWDGGKMGFQFLPDPADEDIDEYWDEGGKLIKLFQNATGGDPRRILTGEDVAFYESLPDKLTVYRGCSGISPRIAGGGLCWTTKRDIADWFAWRGRSKPLLVTARISKRQIAFVKAPEHEIVVQPTRSREITCRKRPQDWRPEMQWTPPA